MANRWQKGNKHPKWKEIGVGLHALHTWVNRELGKAKFCSECGSTDRNRYEWANISHEYKRDLNDYRPLCCSCHRKYDMTPDLRKKLATILRVNHYKHFNHV